MKLQKGLLQIYTGNGKGKTTAAIGLANRATASGLKVTFIQFLKSGHDKQTITQNPKIEYYNFGLDPEKFGWLKKENDFTISPHLDKFHACVKEAWQKALEIIETGNTDLLILDELNIALDYDLISLTPITQTIISRPEHMEILITGRNAPAKLLEIADLITEMKEIKHPYSKGINAREGIDY